VLHTPPPIALPKLNLHPPNLPLGRHLSRTSLPALTPPIQSQPRRAPIPSLLRILEFFQVTFHSRYPVTELEGWKLVQDRRGLTAGGRAVSGWEGSLESFAVCFGRLVLLEEHVGTRMRQPHGS
jgi:hypothetical protein